MVISFIVYSRDSLLIYTLQKINSERQYMVVRTVAKCSDGYYILPQFSLHSLFIFYSVYTYYGLFVCNYSTTGFTTKIIAVWWSSSRTSHNNSEPLADQDFLKSYVWYMARYLLLRQWFSLIWYGLERSIKDRCSHKYFSYMVDS